ncbi:MAG: hypothetical protein WBC04_02925 [Candidatus Acidiferrales bacterium]
MDSKFDIFRRLPDGKPVWMGTETFEVLDEAKMRLDRLALTYPGEYFIYSLKDGRVIDPHHVNLGDGTVLHSQEVK